MAFSSCQVTDSFVSNEWIMIKSLSVCMKYHNERNLCGFETSH